MTQQQIEDLANDALDIACLIIQTKLKIKDGDVAMHFFSDNIVSNELQAYIKAELKRSK